MLKVGDKVMHQKYGEGTIVEDKNQDCRKEEVLVKFKDKLPFAKVDMNSKYAGWTNYADTDIFNISELKKLENYQDEQKRQVIEEMEFNL